MTTLNLTQASDQWCTRPEDERFWTLEEMHRETLAHAHAAIEVPRTAQDCRLIYDPQQGIRMDAGDGHPPTLGHYAFTQLCRQYGAPSSYMRSLPGQLAVECLEENRTRAHDDRDRLLLIDQRDNRLRATTSQRYARVWNHEIVERLRYLQADGWVVPPARPNSQTTQTRIATEDDVLDFGESPLSVKVGDEIAPAGLYASDHDMFAFLIHPEIVVDNGLSPHGMRRGMMISQSEVGAASIWKLDFLFDTVCGNHIVWGATDVRETSIRHMGSAGENWVAMIRNITKDAQAGAKTQEEEVRRAQEILLGEGKEEIMELLFKKRWVGKRAAGRAFDLAEQHSEAHGDPRSLWGMVSGLTRLSQEEGFTDSRTAIDRAAGKMLAACLN